MESKEFESKGDGSYIDGHLDELEENLIGVFEMILDPEYDIYYNQLLSDYQEFANEYESEQLTDVQKRKYYGLLSALSVLHQTTQYIEFKVEELNELVEMIKESTDFEQTRKYYRTLRRVFYRFEDYLSMRFNRIILRKSVYLNTYIHDIHMFLSEVKYKFLTEMEEMKERMIEVMESERTPNNFDRLQQMFISFLEYVEKTNIRIDSVNGFVREVKAFLNTYYKN